MKNIIITICFFLCTAGIKAQVGEIKGKVLDAVTKETILGASVYIETGGKKIGTVTDINGRFTIKPLPPGVYNLNISFIGYKTDVLNNISVNPDKITFIDDIKLVTGSKDIAEYTIHEYKVKLIDPSSPGKMTILAADMEKLANVRNVGLVLGTISSDIKVSDDGSEVHFRGSRPGAGSYYLDGVLIHSLDNIVPSTAIGSMTVYTGGIPAQYGDVTGGVVVIETKSYFDLYNQRMARKNK